jgi:hypothetical protein
MPATTRPTRLLSELRDVTIDEPQDGQDMTFNAEDGKWGNADPTGDEGGGSFDPAQDLLITGDGSLGTAPAEPCVGLGVEENGNAHIEVVSPAEAGVAYIDLTVPGVDTKARIAWVASDQTFRIETNGHTLAINSGGVTVDGGPIGATAGIPRVYNLKTDYGVSPEASSADNAAAIAQAFVDSGGFVPIYLPAGRYPCDPVLLPNFPIRWYGDGRALSVLKFAQGIPYAISYDNSSDGHIPSDSPWWTNSVNGANSNHAWDLKGLGFEGGDWAGDDLNAGLYFPDWAGGNTRDKLALRLNDIGVYLFKGPGILYEINGLFGDSVFTDVDVAACSGVGVIPGSDQRWINLLAHDCGSWGMKPNDHRNTQFLGGKAYGNGQVGHTAGGYCIVGDQTLMNNLYTQDNYGPGFKFDGAKLVQAGQLFADRNCVNATDLSGMVINDCDGVIVDGYGATDTARTLQAHALKVTGTNSSSVVRLVQVDTAGGTLGDPVESNSGGVTVYTPIGGE